MMTGIGMGTFGDCARCASAGPCDTTTGLDIVLLKNINIIGQ